MALFALQACGDRVAGSDHEPSRSAQFVRVEPPDGAAPQSGPAPADAPPAAGTEGQLTAPPPSPAPSGPIGEAAAVGSLEAREIEANAALASGPPSLAAQRFSALLLDGVRSAMPPTRDQLRTWSRSLARAQAAHRWNRRGTWSSIEVTVQPGDSLIAIRARVLATNPGLLLSTGLIARANELTSEAAIRPGDVLRIPTDRPGALVDVSAMWTLFTLGDEVASSWEVGVGKDQSPTRTGTYTVGLKQKEPMWTPVGREPIAYGDPGNPLGSRWLAWFAEGKNTSLGFHGTNDSSTVGQRISDGCIRMRNEDVELLYEILPRDSTVRVEP